MITPAGHGSYIAGRWVEGDIVRQSINPFTGEPIGAVRQASVEHISLAIEAASKALPRWRDVAPEERAAFLEAALRLVYEQRDEIAHLISTEQGKPIAESYSLEVIPSLDMLEFYTVHGPAWLTPKRVTYEQPYFTGKESRVFFSPLGVTAIATPSFSPWLAPLTTTCLALLAGNSVILKPSTYTQLTGLRIAKLFDAIGLPEGLLSVITGDDELADRLIAEPIQAAVYIGDREGAQKFLDASNENFKKAIISCGGRCPMMVLDDADIDAAARRGLWGALANNGQSHGSMSLMLVHKAVAQRFREKLVELLGRLRYGDPLSCETDLGPMIGDRHFAALDSLISQAASEGAEVLRAPEVPPAPASFYRAAILWGVSGRSELLRRIVPGPVALVVECDDDEEMVRTVSSLSCGLSASIWSASGERAGTLARRINFANIWVNDVMFPFEAPNAPWGATGQSGNGQICSPYGLLEYIYLKHVGFDKPTGSNKDYYFPYDTELAASTERVLESLATGSMLTRFLKRLKVKEGSRSGRHERTT